MQDPFKLIAQIFESLIDIFKQLGNIQDFLSCPAKLFGHFDKCMLFFIVDLIVYIIFILIKLICFIFIFIPIWLAWDVVAHYIAAYIFNYDLPDVPFDDCYPPKDSIAWTIETVNYYTGAFERAVFRNNGDISTCYCIKPIKRFFDPYTSFEPLDQEMQGKSSSVTIYIVMISILIIFINGFVSFMKKNKTPDENVSANADGENNSFLEKFLKGGDNDENV